MWHLHSDLQDEESENQLMSHEKNINIDDRCSTTQKPTSKDPHRGQRSV